MLTPELQEQLVKNKRTIIRILSKDQPGEWPQQCLESQRRFGVCHARLYPLIDKRVMTPQGRGRLLQVLSYQGTGVVRVLLDRKPNPATEFRAKEISPLNGDEAKSKGKAAVAARQHGTEDPR